MTRWFEWIGNMWPPKPTRFPFLLIRKHFSRNCINVETKAKTKMTISDVADSFYGCVKNIKVNNRFLLATDMKLQGNVLPNSCPNWREAHLVIFQTQVLVHHWHDINIPLFVLLAYCISKVHITSLIKKITMPVPVICITNANPGIHPAS